MPWLRSRTAIPLLGVALLLIASLPVPPIFALPPATTATTAACCRSGHSGGSHSHSSSHIRAPHIRAPHIRAPHIRAPHIRAPHIRAPHIRAPRSYAPRSYAPRSHAPRSYTPSPYTPHSHTPRTYSYRAPGARDVHGRLERSEDARRKFERETGHPGGWPGHVIDHRIPLACGGADSPSNMQWQTTADAKAKDRTERAGCRG